MSLAMTIFSMIAAWMAISLAMLWGLLRIARRHQSCAEDITFPDVTRGQTPMPRSLSLVTSSN
ncbi:hypothetical protein D3C86_1598600 [compost metagenome]